jgi:hypothetical protein
MLCKVDENRDGAPGRIRTPDPQIRSLVLYPAELRARSVRRRPPERRSPKTDCGGLQADLAKKAREPIFVFREGEIVARWRQIPLPPALRIAGSGGLGDRKSMSRRSILIHDGRSRCYKPARTRCEPVRCSASGIGGPPAHSDGHRGFRHGRGMCRAAQADRAIRSGMRPLASRFRQARSIRREPAPVHGRSPSQDRFRRRGLSRGTA